VPNRCHRTHLIALAIACVACVSAFAQSEGDRRTQQRGGTFIEAPRRVAPVYLPQGPDGRKATPSDADADRLGLSLRLSVDLPLKSVSGLAGRGVQGSPPSSPTAQAVLRWQPPGLQPWFAQIGFLRYLHGDRQQPWNPDFTYAFGYEDHRPGTFSATYSNYAGNRFEPDRARRESRFNFDRGQWSLGYKFLLPEALDSAFLLGDGDSALCGANLNFTPRYTTLAGGEAERGKESMSLGCRYTHPQGWFGFLTAFAYPGSGEQQPWDPDFTYGFGMAGGALGPLTLQYSNYSGNRFPGRGRSPGQGSWRNGSVSLSWGTNW
jgi:hypothetical protein